MQKLNKNILLVYLLIFTVFNTGIPVVLHYCQALNKVDLTLCPMCRADHSKSGMNIKHVNNCCTSKLAAAPTEANYLVTHQLNQVNISDFAFLLPVTKIFSPVNETGIEGFNDTSPPDYKAKDINILNSTFLI